MLSSSTYILYVLLPSRSSEPLCSGLLVWYDGSDVYTVYVGWVGLGWVMLVSYRDQRFELWMV